MAKASSKARLFFTCQYNVGCSTPSFWASLRVVKPSIPTSLSSSNAHVRLVMVANDLPALTDPLVSDVLRALTVSPDQVLQLTPEKIAMLPQGSHCNSWRLGTDEPLSLEGAQVASPALTDLRANPTARAALWQQICTYEHDFFPRND